MRIFSVICMLFILLGVMSIQVNATDLQSELEEGLDPEQGLNSEIIDQIGHYDGTVTGFGNRVLILFRKTLGNLNAFGLNDGLRTLGMILASAMLCAILEDSQSGKASVPLVGGLTITAACVRPIGSMITLGTDMIRELHTYTGLLMPGMTGLMAASGSLSATAVSGIGMILFNLLLSLTSGLLIPLLYLFLVLGVAESSFGLEQLSKLRDFLKWLLVGSVKLLMWSYSAILTMTGLISGTLDGQKLRSMKSAISGMVPVVGNIVSEASASLLSAASILRTGVGLYGVLAVFGICLAPFFRMAIQYLLLRLGTGLCGLLGKGGQSPLLEKLCQAMGLMLALTGIACLLSLMILVLCIRTVSL